ncbi:MAG: SIS domain-containing protein [Bacteroidales bacterium]|jgi:D-sedoheptulose 7-phosphate isomerase|nr:SIS domain-containing protein [Bacteroidales bacterium]
MSHYLQKELDALLTNYPQLSSCRDDIWNVCALVTGCYRQGGLVMTCGNGGSAADAEHIVGELMKSFKRKRLLSGEQRAVLEAAFPGEGAYLADHLQQGIPAISLVSQVALLSAFANDVVPDMAFAQQVFVYGCPGDVLIGLSTSGNSRNVVNACRVARAYGMKTVALTGEHGGKLRDICDVTVRVPANETCRIQEYHLPVYHALCAMVERDLFHFPEEDVQTQ